MITINNFNTVIFGGVRTRVADLFSFLSCLVVLFVFIMWLVYLMLTVTLGCPFMTALSIFSNVHLFPSNTDHLIYIDICRGMYACYIISGERYQ